MEKHTFTVNRGNSGLRLDHFLVRRFPKTISRTYLQKLIHHKNILVNGAPRKSHYKIEAGDFVQVEIPKPEGPVIKAENIPISVVFEDDRLLIVNKPAGMVVHPAAGNYSGTLVNALLHYTNELYPSGDVRPGIVHRLDKDTSGLLIVAKDETARSFLARQFQKAATDKRYLAIVDGVVQLDNGIISYPLGRHPRDRKKMSVKFADAKDAVTHYKVMERFKDNTFLEIRPKTGRTHQIRVHMAYIGHPISADRTYGAKKKSTLMARQALHAAEITFLHPETKKLVHFNSPLPADMKEAIGALKNKN